MPRIAKGRRMVTKVGQEKTGRRPAPVEKRERPPERLALREFSWEREG